MESSGGIKGYTILEELGKGGFATVYKVRDDEFGYIRAVRVLHEPIISEESETYRKFKRECNVLLRLGNGNHPNIIHICRPRLVGTLAMVEMDYINGLDISKYIEREKGFVDVKEVISMATQISSALAYCHEDIYLACMDRDIDHLKDDPEDGSKVIIDEETRQRLIEKYKVIHNDIHSGNIMRSHNGNYILLDFGLAINGSEVVRSSSRHSNGSPEFKAPEKWNNERLLTEQSDIYSFGIVMYMLLAGRVPFQYDISKGATMADFEILKAHENMVPPSIEAFRKERFEQKYEGQQYKRDYPQWLENAIFKCLEKNPNDRFKNGKELFEFIQNHIEDQSVNEPKEKKEKNSKRNKELDDEEMTYLIGKNKELKAQNTDLFNAYNNVNKEKNAFKEQLEVVKDDLEREKEAYKFLKRQYERLNPTAYKILISVFVVLTIAVFGIANHNHKRLNMYYESNEQYKKDLLHNSVTMDSLRMNINNLNETISSLSDENQQLKDAQTQSGDYYALKSRKEQLEKENNDLKGEIKRKDLDIENLKYDRSKCEAEVQQLMEKLDQYEN